MILCVYISFFSWPPKWKPLSNAFPLLTPWWLFEHKKLHRKERCGMKFVFANMSDKNEAKMKPFYNLRLTIRYLKWPSKRQFFSEKYVGVGCRFNLKHEEVYFVLWIKVMFYSHLLYHYTFLLYNATCNDIFYFLRNY